MAAALGVLATVAVVSYFVWWISFTVTRLDRLHVRVDAAEATLDAELVRRAAALQRLRAVAPDPEDPGRITPARLPPLGSPERESAENDVTRAATAELARVECGPLARDPDVVPAAAAVREACERVHLARLFYDDAVRDSRILRARRLTRVLHLAGHRALPPYFDIDDTVPPVLVPTGMTSGVTSGVGSGVGAGCGPEDVAGGRGDAWTAAG